MARIAILSVPAYGHLNPVLPITGELVRRGHSVTVFNEASFEPLIRATGAGFAAYPPVIHLEDFSRTLKDGDMIAWIEMIFSATGPLLGATYAALRDDPPDLIVFDGVALWGEMLAKKLRVPSVSISTTFASDAFARDFGQFVQDTLNAIKLSPRFFVAVLKMTWHGALAMPSPFPPLVPRRGTKTLMMTSRDFHPPSRIKASSNFSFVGCSIAPHTRQEAFDFSRLDGRPLLYISLGTLHHGNSAFFDTCIDAFRDYDGQVLLSVGRGTDLAPYANAPANFIFAEAVPQLAILERARIFLTHGGLNSTHEGLWHGVPMVAVPQQLEQFHNAQAMQAAGAGITIDSEIHGQHVTAAALRAAIARVEAGHAGFAAAAAGIGATLRDGGGYVEAANRIEEVAGRRSAAIQPESAIRPLSGKA